jgi:hypothetical protein
MMKIVRFFVYYNWFFISFVFMETIKLNNKITVNQLVEEAKQLSPKDRLKISDVIWNDNVEIPIEHQKIALDRMTKAKANPERLLDWDEVSENL